MFVEMWGFRRLMLSSNARIISNAPYACGAGFQLSLLNSISVIISGFSFCLRRGIPAFAVKLRLCYHLRLFFACGAVLSWAESTQRPPLSWKRAPKEPKTSSPVAHLRYLFPVAAQNSAWSFFLAYAAPRAPSLLELPALFCLRRSIKESGWRESGGNS